MNQPTTTTLHKIPTGAAGVRVTLNTMRHLTRTFKKNIQIRELALSLVRQERQKDWLAEIRRLYAYVKNHIRYVRDINQVETIATPVKTLEYGQGDCDDQAVLLAALLESIGHPTQFTAIALNGGPFSHVLVETKMGNRWVTLETTEPVKMGWWPPNVSKVMRVQN